MPSFLIYTIIAAITASIASGITGSFIVSKRIVFISGSLSHSVLGGMGLFLWLRRAFNLPWITPLQGAIVAALLSAYFISYIKEHYKEREDTIIATLWSTGMALGVIFIALTPGYNVELMNFLFGNILWVSPTDIFTLLGLDGIISILTLLFFHKFRAVCFDQDQAILQNIKSKNIYTLLLCMIALSVVLLIQMVGSILVIAILTIPPAITNQFTHRLSTMILGSIGTSIVLSLIGIGISYHYNWPPGASICLACAAGYLVVMLRKLWIR